MRQTAVSTSQRSAWKGPRRAILAAAAATMILQPIAASAANVSIVRDAETETLIKDYARPIFKAAGIQSNSVDIFLVPSQAFNAFVASADKMFINVGAIIQSDTPNELIGIIAHETGHLAHGDLASLREQIARAKTAATIAGALGIGAAVAGAATGVHSLSQAGAGIAMGGIQVAQRSFLHYRREQETAADRAAVTYLERTHQSGAGMLATLKRLSSDELFASREVDPYLQSHPLAKNRLVALEKQVTSAKYYKAKDPPALQRRHDLVRAKLIGFTWKPAQVLRKYPRSDTSLPARYARAVSAYLYGPLDTALKQIDGLIASEPRDPYFWELKGQALLEGGKPDRSLAPLRKAVALAPNEGLIRILLGQALVATDNKGVVNEAIKNLTIGLQQEPDVPIGFRNLARAYAMKGDIPMAELATAQGYFANGQVKDAKIHAERAQAKLKRGTPAWLRADDIVSYKAPLSARSGGMN